MGALFRVLLMAGLVVRLWWIAVTLGAVVFSPPIVRPDRRRWAGVTSWPT
jgi:hypothetical protein